MQPNEIWKDIQGYEGLYQVSTLGRVRSLDRLIKSRYGNFRKITGKIIKPNNIIRKSKFPPNPERSVQFSGKRTKRSVQKIGCTQHL